MATQDQDPKIELRDLMRLKTAVMMNTAFSTAGATFMGERGARGLVNAYQSLVRKCHRFSIGLFTRRSPQGIALGVATIGGALTDHALRADDNSDLGPVVQNNC